MAYTFKHGDRPLEGYTIQRAVGSGGFGEVYYAISDGGREVALKYLKSNPQVELRGVSHCINLKSPHLVSIFDVKQDKNEEYHVIMEYCSGPSLRDLLIAEPNGFKPEKAAFFVRELAKGLSYLHERGIVHRDMKPGNIFYDDGYVKIGDYGLSKFISVSRHSAQTASIGTVHYMAPEIGSGDYSRGIDIYALGVMLYEMLLGKVPFDGSTMGEVLMKHLTSQPAIDELPAPFGKVIRKALEKDPKDRYQTVDEMIDDMLEVEQVRTSLAGFSPQSLDGAVARGGAGHASSPIPSPNPTPHQPNAWARPANATPDANLRNPQGGPPPIPPRLDKKQEKIAHKIDKKIAKLSGKRYRRRQYNRAGEAANQPSLQTQPNMPPRRKQMLLSLLLSAGFTAALAIIVGVNSYGPFAASAAMMTVAMSAGIVVSRPAIRWFGADQGPTWATRVITAGCCGLPMLVGAIPLLANQYGEEGLAIIVALLVVSVFGNWGQAFDDGAEGELHIWRAIWTGFGTLIVGFICSGIFNARPEEDTALTAAGIACAVALIIRANGWWLVKPTERLAQKWDAYSRGSGDDVDYGVGQTTEPDNGMPTMSPLPQFAKGENESDSATNKADVDPQSRLERWGITRAFWGLLTFCLMCSVITLAFLLALMRNLNYDDKTGVIIGMIASAAVATFTVRKTTPLRRDGIWLEHIRPAVLFVLLFAICGLIVGISRYWSGHGLLDEQRVAMLSGLVVLSPVFLAVLFLTGGKKRVRPFIGATSFGEDEAFVIAAGIGLGDDESQETDGTAKAQGFSKL